jgi:hypothetical protein
MHLPKADDQQQADNCLLVARGDDISPHWLVYEVARDFLSVPRTFAVVAIYSDYEFEWHEAEAMAENEQGILQVKAEPDSEPEQPSDLDCWRITLPRMKLDVWGSLQLKTTLYGAASATEALIRVLSADALGAGAGSVFGGEK